MTCTNFLSNCLGPDNHRPTQGGFSGVQTPVEDKKFGTQIISHTKAHKVMSPSFCCCCRMLSRRRRQDLLSRGNSY